MILHDFSFSILWFWGNILYQRLWNASSSTFCESFSVSFPKTNIFMWLQLSFSRQGIQYWSRVSETWDTRCSKKSYADYRRWYFAVRNRTEHYFSASNSAVLCRMYTNPPKQNFQTVTWCGAWRIFLMPSKRAAPLRVRQSIKKIPCCVDEHLSQQGIFFIS